MFGINDIGIIGAVSLAFLSMCLCIAYGLINWNKE